MGIYNATRLSYEDLINYTHNFCETNYLGHFQFGKLYRGEQKLLTGNKDLLVKIWEISEIYNYMDGDNELRLIDEIILLRHEKFIRHPGLIRLYGYCLEGEHVGAVYELKAFDTVYNLIPKDCFTWLQRIRVALGFASLLKYLHSGNSQYKHFIVRNLDAAHIVLDEDYNPKLCDFGMVTGGIFPDRTVFRLKVVFGSYGYIDLCAFYSGKCSVKQDVFAFGVIVLSLISKRVYTEEDRQACAPCVNEWARREYDGYNSDGDRIVEPKSSLVHESLTADPDFCAADGRRITALAYRCVSEYDNERPTMKQVLKSLLKLRVVKKHADFIGVNKWRRPFDS